MSETDMKSIVIAMFQYSVVVKGIERRFSSKYTVRTISENLEPEINSVAGSVDLIMIYLPSDITDDSEKRKELQNIIDTIKIRGQKAILIGDRKYYNDLMDQMRGLAEFKWVDRPLDMDELEKIVKSEITGENIEGKKSRILIVDDDPSYAKMVREWIKDKYRTDIVTAGMQAISFLLKIPAGEEVDLILLDYEMPVVDGPQVLQMLRQDPATKKIPIVFLTGNSTKEAVSRVMELKPDGYILKSATRDDLLSAIRKFFPK